MTPMVQLEGFTPSPFSQNWPPDSSSGRWRRSADTRGLLLSDAVLSHALREALLWPM